jgi:hypothetical protein
MLWVARLSSFIARVGCEPYHVAVLINAMWQVVRQRVTRAACVRKQLQALQQELAKLNQAIERGTHIDRAR